MNQRQRLFNSEFENSTFPFMEQLFRLAYAHVRNAQDAEDIIQETYLKAWRGYIGVRERSTIKSWITRILINTVHDHQRKKTRAVQTVELSELDGVSAIESRQAGPEEQLCHEEVDPQLLNALHSIPIDFLTPLLMREIHDCTYEDIAETLGIPIGTVMSRLFRGRSMLRKLLQKSTDTPPLNETKKIADEDKSNEL